jgi:hypothetical protein
MTIIFISDEDDYRRTAYTVRRRTMSSLHIAPTIPETESESSTSKNEVGYRVKNIED